MEELDEVELDVEEDEEELLDELELVEDEEVDEEEGLEEALEEEDGSEDCDEVTLSEVEPVRAMGTLQEERKAAKAKTKVQRIDFFIYE